MGLSKSVFGVLVVGSPNYEGGVMREFAQGLIALCVVILCITLPIAIGDYFEINRNYSIVVGCVIFLVIAYRVITRN